MAHRQAAADDLIAAALEQALRDNDGQVPHDPSDRTRAADAGGAARASLGSGPIPWSLRFRRLGELVTITGELALMIRTGTSLVEAFEALGAQSADRMTGRTLLAIAKEMTGGSTLHHALASHPSLFSPLYVSVVKAGESSGSLGEMFRRLEAYLQKRHDLRTSILTALLYPAIVSVLAVVAVVFVMTFVIPRFLPVFERSGIALPLPTRILMGLAGGLVSYWYIVIPAVAGLGTGGWLFLQSATGRRVKDAVMLSLPVVGPLTRVVQSSMLLRTLGTLLKAGVPMMESLEVVGEACSNSYYRDFVGDVAAGVVRGEDLTSQFEKTHLLSPSIKQMVATGERTGALPEVLNSVSDHLDNIGEKQVRRLGAILEPLIIIVMGIIIGFIAISLLLPVFRLTSAAGSGF